MHVSIITTCKGYLRHLKRSLPAMLAQECPIGDTFDVIVVDYQCPDATFQWLKEIKFEDGREHRLRGVLVLDGTELFSGPRSRNIGSSQSSADVLFYCDADDIPPPNAMRDGLEKIRDGAVLVNWTRDFGPPEPSCFGAAMVVRNAWEIVRGYDESLGGRYGFDDADFYTRVRKYFRFTTIPVAGWDFCQQSHGEATRFYETDDFEKSKSENSRRIWERRGLVNPESFGQADTRTYSPLSEWDGWMSWSELAWLHDRASRMRTRATWMEIGVYLGRSFHRTGMGLPQGSTLIGVDTFDSKTDLAMPTVRTWKRLAEAVEDLHTKRPDLQIALMTPGAARLIPNESVDGLFIDAIHTSEAVNADLELYFPMVRPGGLISGHDYTRDHYPGLCDVVDRRFPARKIHHTIWEATKPD